MLSVVVPALAGVVADPWQAGTGDLFVAGGFQDAVGTVSTMPVDCAGNTVDRASCLADHGIVAHVTDYQPIGRLAVFHLIELGIYLVLTAVLALVAWHRVRRGNTV
ncbi:hypothetical protein [Goodfellowiella coeruleoviolacea]|uniref:ABC transporter permease n=1 Tax=Goodfellowiella coeruleoviolacea TaxID=334858 RepID=A0AAE3KFN3_9PSEU|nr:hypothetical protein [Goodfellowiella coeruleoviolacea]MCP2166536.1 hypothetical protein [Goodfellowiella coeruleoviolacea]